MMAKAMAMTMAKKLTFIFIFALTIALAPAYLFCAPAKVALMPVKASAKENPEFLGKIATDMLSSKLGRDPHSIALISAPVATDDAPNATAVKLGAEYVVSSNLTVESGSLKLDARIYIAADGSTISFASTAQGLDSIIALTDRLAEAVFSAIRKNSDTGGDSAIILVPKDAPISWKSRMMNGTFLAMNYADLDGDGTKELILLSKRNIVIARVKPDGLETIKEFKANLNTVYAAITAIDTDGDGARELYVSGIVNGLTSGMRIEYVGNEYRITESGIKWMMRSFKSSGAVKIASNPEGAILVGQKLRVGSGFLGPLAVLKKSGAETIETGVFMPSLPPDADIYRIELPDPASGDEVFVLDVRGYFRAYGKNDQGAWTALYKSSDYYGGTLNLMEDADATPGNEQREPSPIEGAFYFVDLNRDGKSDVVLKRNVSSWLGRLSKFPRSFNEGMIISLSWDKNIQNYTEEWKTKPMAGYVADFFIEQAPDGGRIIYILVVTPDEKSYVLSRKM